MILRLAHRSAGSSSLIYFSMFVVSDNCVQDSLLASANMLSPSSVDFDMSASKPSAFKPICCDMSDSPTAEV